MCYSFRTSLLSYSLGIISAILAFVTNQYVLGCLIFSYAQMQLSEMMIWHGIDTKNINWNKNGTFFGKYLLPTHNIAIGVGILLSIIFLSKRKLIYSDFIPIILGFLFFIYIISFVYTQTTYPDVTFPLNKTCKKDCQNPGNRLQWPFPHNWYTYSFIISLFILILWIKPLSSKFLLLFIFIITFIISYIYFPKTVGSVWCLSTSLIAPLLVIINYFLIKNINKTNIVT